MSYDLGELLLITYHAFFFGAYVNPYRQCGVQVPEESLLSRREPTKFVKKFVARAMLPRCDILAESVRCQFDSVTPLIHRQFAIPSVSEVVIFGKAFGSL